MRAVCALILSVPGSAFAGTVSLTTTDGLSLKGQDWGSGVKGILLVHEDGGDLQDWTTLAPKLAANGFRVLAVDLRGHGTSSATGTPSDADYPKMVADVKAGVGWLQKQGATEVHVVGAALGANLALNVAAGEPGITDLVMLSPQLNAKGVKVSAPLSAYGNRPLMVVASQDDTLSAKAATWLSDNTTGPKHLELYPSAGTGARMLNGAPDSFENLVLSWVNGTFLQATDMTAAKQAEVKSGDVNNIEATGTKLEDRER